MSDIPEIPANPAIAAVEPTAPAIAAAPEAPVITPDEAVERCMTAYYRAYNASAAKKNHISQCEVDGHHAYCLAMPSTGTLAGVQAFIACVVRGIHMQIWIRHQARDLFCAARIAISAHRQDSVMKKIAH
jgi:hypothetical protein